MNWYEQMTDYIRKQLSKSKVTDIAKTNEVRKPVELVMDITDLLKQYNNTTRQSRQNR